MAVKYTPKFTENDVRNFIAKRVAAVEDAILETLKEVAEQFVSDVRSVNTYTDRTRNLRGSTGYVILKDGSELFGNFDGIGSPEGAEKSRQLVRDIKGEYPKGYVLIVAVGMNYALFVEAKGFDVMTGGADIAEGNIKKAFDRLKTQLSKLK